MMIERWRQELLQTLLLLSLDNFVGDKDDDEADAHNCDTGDEEDDDNDGHVNVVSMEVKVTAVSVFYLNILLSNLHIILILNIVCLNSAESIFSFVTEFSILILSVDTVLHTITEQIALSPKNKSFLHQMLYLMNAASFT